ncbi:MAG: biotin carboxylase N-terminal domain-containing protein [Pseudomonadota bacterium]
MSFDSILIANRGEIACRIIRTARAIGLRTIAVYSDADEGAPHVVQADDAVRIGPPPAGESYLRGDAMIAAAVDMQAGAIHPGYGFLSENDRFAEAVADAGLVFIGPPSKAISLMGNKAAAKRLMLEAGVPCVPGYHGKDQSDEAFIEAATNIGFPVMVKAADGGGGKGMRQVENEHGLAAALAIARSEAESAFGSNELILEKAIDGARHVEIQVFADIFGNTIHLGERDCSIQRRHQKVIEEAPCPVVSPGLRQAMGEAAVSAAKAVDYRGAGTVEFLLDSAGAFFFLEMNTRLQVEHPVTEMVTGLDLVALQIAISRGEKLPLTQNNVALGGHAIEARLYAEDPARDFMPDAGTVDLWRPAGGEGVRVDAGIDTGFEIPPHYDPLLAKIIAWGDSRETARLRLIQAIEDSVLLGPATNASFLIDILKKEAFANGTATTRFIADTYPEGISAADPGTDDVALAAALFLARRRDQAFAQAGYVSRSQLGWSSAPLPMIPLKLIQEEQVFDISARCRGTDWTLTIGAASSSVDSLSHTSNQVRARINGRRVEAFAFVTRTRISLAIAGKKFTFSVLDAATSEERGDSGRVVAPMPGLVIDVLVKAGETVAKGDVLAVLEAMKMQHRVVAKASGTLNTIKISPGDRLGSGDLMFMITEAGA